MAHLSSSDGHMLSASKALTLHLLCVLALAAAFWVAQNIFASNLISNPTHTLCLLWIFECPVVIFSYSLLRQNPQQCSYLKAIGRALLGLPAGAVLNAFGAIVLGAPIRIEYLTKTINWSLLMSLFTVKVLFWPILEASSAFIDTNLRTSFFVEQRNSSCSP